MKRVTAALACTAALMVAGCGDDKDQPAPDRPPRAGTLPAPNPDGPAPFPPYGSGQPAPDGVTDVVRPDQLR